MAQNRKNIVDYIESNIYLWMLWSIIGMSYANFGYQFFFEKNKIFLMVIANLLHYIFLFIVILSLVTCKILRLSPEEAQHIAKTINPYQD